ncbi:acetyltransferase, GNAT family [Pseudoalteromonas luteoviolacea B = ATCC 29581]|nr:acetyltransferase, GNAT family [Pseudoalteromonas luteoviolacea B = ATCC 29581]
MTKTGDTVGKLHIEEDVDSVASFLSKQLVAFNQTHWDVTVKKGVAITIKDDAGLIEAGLSGVTFGNWLHIERLWVNEAQRGKGYGETLLLEAHRIARERGCQFALLDTLEFQAKPFYEKHGYQVQWVQSDYPLHGAKYFMTKEL